MEKIRLFQGVDILLHPPPPLHWPHTGQHIPLNSLRHTVLHPCIPLSLPKFFSITIIILSLIHTPLLSSKPQFWWFYFLFCIYGLAMTIPNLWIIPLGEYSPLIIHLKFLIPMIFTSSSCWWSHRSYSNGCQSRYSPLTLCNTLLFLMLQEKRALYII